MQLNMFFINIARSVISGLMFVFLLFTLGKLKCSKKVMYLFIIVVFSLDISTSIMFYLRNDFTTLAKFDVFLYVIIGISAKFLNKDTIMQWFFNCITAVNIYAAIVILSYFLANYFQNPYYANIYLRFIFFVGVIFLFRTYLRPLYRRAVELWNVYLFVALAILMNFTYYIIFSDDIEKTFTDNCTSLILLILLAVSAYVCIFYALKKITGEYKLKEENAKMQSNQDILNISLNAMNKKLEIMNESINQNNIINHDQRHYNNMLLELLQQGQVDQAVNILKKQNNIIPGVVRSYCKNSTINAAVTYFAKVAKNENIKFIAKLDIPEKLHVNSLELVIVVSNLLENAINASKKINKESNPYVKFTCIYTKQLLLEIENPYINKIELDENDYPISKEEGHGIGTKSIIDFIERQDAQIIYNISEKIFRVNIII